MRFERPTAPLGFDQTVERARRTIKAIIDGGSRPASKDFEDLWGTFKDEFAKAQSNKCGYCEQEVVANQFGEVEHHAPKANVTRLLQRGREMENSASIRGRRVEVVSESGYWWRAYDWKNYLLACQVCNRTWKGNLYPVVEASPVWPPTSAQPNTPLLLGPFGPLDPAEHLSFDTIGAIAPRNGSIYGRATIEVCGLDRLALTRRRAKLAARVHRKAQELVAKLASAHPEIDLIERLAQDLVELGEPSELHCGMVRSIVRDYLDLPWADVEALARVSSPHGPQ